MHVNGTRSAVHTPISKHKYLITVVRLYLDIVGLITSTILILNSIFNDYITL